jgi:hypothetical protein
MEINSYILRAVLARFDVDNEGAALVGTSPKENLGNATTVEDALRHLDQFVADPAGFDSTFSQLIGLGTALEPPAPKAGAGITITPSSPVHRVDAKGTIGAATIVGTDATLDYADTNTVKALLHGNYVLAVANVEIGQRIILKLKQDSAGNRTVTWFPNIRWASGGAPPALTSTANKSDWFGFILDDDGFYDGFVIGTNI